MSYLTRHGQITPRAVSAIGGGLMNILFHSRASILHGLHQRMQERRAGYQHDMRKHAIGAFAATHALRHPVFAEVMRDDGLKDKMARALERVPQASFVDLYRAAKTPQLR